MKKALIFCLLFCLPARGQPLVNQGGHMYPFESALSKTLNDTYTIENSGFMTMGFYIVPPTGGTISVELSYNAGASWEPASMRSQSDDLWQSTITTTGNFIGSVAASKQIRFRTSTAGSAAGSIVGELTRNTAIQEGLEFGNPPHRFGYVPIHKNGSYTTQQTATALWTPTSGKTYVITDMLVIVGGSTDGEIKIFDNTDAAGNYLVKGSVEVATNKNVLLSDNFVTPFVASAADNVLKITTSAAITVDVILHGYEF